MRSVWFGGWEWGCLRLSLVRSWCFVVRVRVKVRVRDWVVGICIGLSGLLCLIFFCRCCGFRIY